MLNTLTRLKYNVYKLVQNYLIQSKPTCKLRKYDQPRYLQLYKLSSTCISQMHDVMTRVCVESYVYDNSHTCNHAQVHVIILFSHSNIIIAWQTHTEKTISTLEMNLVSSFPKPFVHGIME